MVDKPTRLMYMMTVPQSFIFTVGRIGFMKEKGFEVHGLSSPGPALTKFGHREQIPVHGIEMRRKVTPLQDLKAILKLVRLFRRTRPDILHAATPKGGLLGMIAGLLSGVPIRIYDVLGLPHETATGIKRWVLRLTEKVSCLLAHQVLCDSHSLREVLIREGICPSSKIKVYANGSVNGVDAVGCFNPEAFSAERRRAIRTQLQVPDEAVVIGFVGRLVRDKGVIELVEAWKTLSEQFDDLHLLVVGAFDERDRVPSEVEAFLRNDPRIHLAGYVSDIPTMYSAMDVFVLPTYREGFGSVLIEAAAMELPVVSTQVTGPVDAVRDGVNGTLVPVRDSVSLASAIRRYVEESGTRRQHGQAGREWVLEAFRPELVWNSLLGEYERLMRDRGIQMVQQPGEGATADGE